MRTSDPLFELIEPYLDPLKERILALEHQSLLQQESTNRWLSRNEVAKYIQASPSSIDRWAQQGRLTRHLIGGVVRYDRNEIDQRFELQKGTKFTSKSK